MIKTNLNTSNTPANKNTVGYRANGFAMKVKKFGIQLRKGEMYETAVDKALRRMLEKSQEVDDAAKYNPALGKYEVKTNEVAALMKLEKRAKKVLEFAKYINSEYQENPEIVSGYGRLDAEIQKVLKSVHEKLDK